VKNVGSVTDRSYGNLTKEDGYVFDGLFEKSYQRRRVYSDEIPMGEGMASPNETVVDNRKEWRVMYNAWLWEKSEIQPIFYPPGIGPSYRSRTLLPTEDMVKRIKARWTQKTKT
jgi:hypothetical protein